MKYKLTRSYFEKCFTLVLVFGGATFACAQSAPEMQEILKRLERLEKENQALNQEIHALRQDLAAQRSPASAIVSSTAGSNGVFAATQADAAKPETSTSATVEERLALQQNRIDEMAQTKVESSQKFALRITGMALFNTYLNGRHNNNTENPTIASNLPDDATGGGTLRRALSDCYSMDPGRSSSEGERLVVHGFLCRLHVVAGSSGPPADSGDQPDLVNTTLTVVQDKPLISPRDPNSLAQSGVSPLTGAGNLWLWQPQIRLEQRLQLGGDTGLRLQAAGVQTSQLNVAYDPNAYATSPSGSPGEIFNPAAEGRIELWRRWRDWPSWSRGRIPR